MIDKKQAEKLISSARKRQYEAEMNYRETGKDCYYNTMCRNETLAQTLEEALRASEFISKAKKLEALIAKWCGEIESYRFENPRTRSDCVNDILQEIRKAAKGDL